ncbi:MAG: hypothetical protein ACKVOU_03475 [Cytophagales bacterium]
MTIAVSTNTPTQESAIKGFLSMHPDISANEIEMADIYDVDGNFKEIDLSHPGLPITKAYMSWSVNKSKQAILDGKGLSLEEFHSLLLQKRSKFLKNRIALN